MNLPLVFAPQDVLLTPVKPVTRVDKKILNIIKDMKDTLTSCTDPMGVGLAAPQVGIPLAIFITKPTERAAIHVFLNARIINLSKKKRRPKDTLEGCLSVKNTWAYVDRSEYVDLEYMNVEGKIVTERFTGYHSHIIQHEADHLNGVLFTHRAFEGGKKLYAIEKEDGEEKLVPLSF